MGWTNPGTWIAIATAITSLITAIGGVRHSKNTRKELVNGVETTLVKDVVPVVKKIAPVVDQIAPVVGKMAPVVDTVVARNTPPASPEGKTSV